MVMGLVIKETVSRPFFWNIEANVGAGCPNRQDDVELVQLGYFFLGKGPHAAAEVKALAAKVVLGARCTGLESDPLVRVICAHEASRGGTQDGHVSVIPAGVAGRYQDRSGTHTYVLTILNNNILDGNPQVYPRLDLIPNCPPTLKARVLAALVH